MIYLLIFYWIFAALFCFGATYPLAIIENRGLFGAFLGSMILGGILFPVYLGRCLNLEQYA